MPSKSRKRKIISTRLKAFTSFTDTFSSLSLKSGWKSLSGTWVPTLSGIVVAESSAILSVPTSKSDATVTVSIPSGSTGIGVSYWISGAGSYWASYANTLINIGASNCNNGNCSGSENYTATRNCSCTNNYGTCSLTYTDVYGTCARSYGTCVLTNVDQYGTCSLSTSYGTCAQSTTYGTCSSTTSYSICSYTAGTTSYSYFTVSKFSDDCSFYANTTQICAGNCNGQTGTCLTGASKGCCKTTTVSSGSYNYAGCTYNGQLIATGSSWNYAGCSYSGQQVVTGTSWNYSGCSSAGQQVVTGSSWNYSGCSYNGQSVYLGQSSSWNYSGCSSNGQQVVIGWNYSGCSSVGQSIYLGQSSSWNYSGCSSNGQQVVISQTSNCVNGNCSGTESYITSRNCSCPSTIVRTVKTIKSVNGTVTNVGSFAVTSAPTSISATTNSNSVTITAGGSSNTYTNNDGTTYKNFGIIKDDGGTEQGSSVSSFTVNVS